MKFIQQAYNGINDWWAYLVTIILLFFGWQFVGVIPLGAVAYTYSENMVEFEKAANDSFASLGINSNLYLVLVIFTFIAGLISLLIGIKTIHKRKVLSVITSRKKLDWNRIFYAFSVWAVIGLITIAIGYFLTPEDYVWNFKPIPFLILFLISFLLLPLQTSMEEVLFRGYLMQGFGLASTNNIFIFVLIYICICTFSFFVINDLFDISLTIDYIIFGGYILLFYFISKLKIIKELLSSNFSNMMVRFLNMSFTPLILTSVIFGLLHGMNPEVEKLGWISMVYYIGTGLLLGIFTIMDDGTELALGFHAANNIIAAILVTTDWTVFQTDALLIDTSEPSAGIEMFLPVFVLFPIVLYIFSKKYNWTNWSEKMFGEIRKPIQLNEDEFIA